MDTRFSKASCVLFMTCFLVCSIRPVLRQSNAKRCARVLRAVVRVWCGSGEVERGCLCARDVGVL